MITITAAKLRKMKACEDQVALFVATFGENAKVKNTLDNLTRAYQAGLDLGWLAERLAPEAHRAARGRARAAYEAVQGPAYAVYETIRGPAWAAYLDIERPALAAYLDIERPAWAAYLYIQRPARAAHLASRGQAAIDVLAAL